nr:outer membrane protein assembly factor BamA [Blochmannia endosymbiont of Colobopsis nipponica]
MIIISIIIKFLFFTILVFGSKFVCAEQFVIQSINFEGLQRVSMVLVLSNMPFSTGDKINDSDFGKIIKSLFVTGYFEDIQILRDGDSVIVRVREYPIINDISFQGNKIIKEEVLKEILELQDIRIGHMLNSYSLEKVKKDFNEFYYSIGRFQFFVEIAITSLTRNRVDLKIILTEGKLAQVKQINIIGNNEFNADQLFSDFQFYNHFQWWHLIKDNGYQNQRLFHCLQSLRNFYLSRGYVRFNIDSIQIHLTSDKQNVYITIYINEGVQYTFSKIAVSGQMSNLLTKIQQLSEIIQNELYSNLKIEKIKNDIESLSGNNGYVYPNVLINENIDDFNQTVELSIVVNIGNRFYVRQICFDGNYLTEDEVLRREIGQMEGSHFVLYLVEQGKQRLERLGFFDFVTFDFKRVPNVFDQVDVIYKVKERNTGSMNISVGIGSESGANFQFNIQEENLLGKGYVFGLSGIKNHYQTYMEVLMFNPYLTLDSISFSRKFFYNSFNANNAELADYDLKSYGLSFNIGLPIKEYHSLNMGMDYMYNNLGNIKPQVVILRYLKAQNIIPTIIFNHQMNNSLNFSAKDFFLMIGWNYKKLDSNYFPTSGSCFRFLNKIAIPGSDNEYLRMAFDLDQYIPLDINRSWIFMHQVRFGYSMGMCNKEMPFYDNFYAGGINSVRGFKSNTIGPKAAYYKFVCNNGNYDICLVENSNDAIGGNAMAVVRNELIVPLPWIHEKYFDTIRTSLFVDMGSVWDTYWKDTIKTYIAGIPNYKNPKNIRVSGGVSLQWISPFGPIILSYAQLIKKYAGDQLEQFQFNVGKTW